MATIFLHPERARAGSTGISSHHFIALMEKGLVVDVFVEPALLDDLARAIDDIRREAGWPAVDPEPPQPPLAESELRWLHGDR